MLSIFNIAQAGVISDAPNLSQAGNNILTFLLSVFSVVAIIGIVLSGMLYFFAGGDEKRLRTAKRAFAAAVVGTVMGLGALVGVKFLGSMFQ